MIDEGLKIITLPRLGEKAPEFEAVTTQGTLQARAYRCPYRLTR